MLGDVAPRTLKIEPSAVVYPGRDNRTELTIKTFDGRRFSSADLSAVTRWVLVMPDLGATFDSVAADVFEVSGSRLIIDLSAYELPDGRQSILLIAYDAEHPAGQVLVDGVDCAVSLVCRNVSTAGSLPLPLASYVEEAPQDGTPYARQDGGWVPAAAGSVASVNGQTGAVVLAIPSAPADIGAATAAQGAKADTAVQPGSLAAVATSGAYADLTGKPSIPSTAGDVGAIPASEKGAALGVATLDAGSKIPLAQLPAAAITDTFVVNTEAAMLALSAQVGDVAIRPDITSSFILQVEPASTLANWQQIITPSIGGGAAVGSATPQALGSASPGVSGNASREDHVHPMPSAADVGAAAAVHSHDAATTGAAGFMSAADKTKLDGVAAGATANATDAQLRDRSTHTGEQAISTVTGLQAALDGKASTAQVKQSLIIACSDETAALAAGAGKVTFRMPYAFTLTGVRASLVTAQTSGSILTVDINETGTSILSTKLTVDNGEKTSTTAATAAVISDTTLADDAEITIDIDQIGDGTAKGLKITLIGTPA